MKEQISVTSNPAIEGIKNWKEISVYTSQVHATNPWINKLPVIIENVVPVKANDRWILRDENGDGVTIHHGFQNSWKLLAISGGKPLRIFAVGRENNFEPLGAWIDNQYKLLV